MNEAVKNGTTPEEEVHVVDKRRVGVAGQGSATTEPVTRYPSYVEELQERCRQAEEQVERIQNRYKQIQAEMDAELEQTRQRLQRAAESRLEVVKGELYKKLIEVADNLERALQLSENSEKSVLVEGVRATHHLILRELEAEGIRPIQAQGKRFNPSLHEAVDIAEVESERDGLVIEVHKTGYTQGDRLLRAALVRVGRARSN